MPPRYQAPDQGEVALRPGASPVSRYSNPEQQLQDVGPSTATQLSSALSDLVPELLKFSAHADQRKNQNDVIDARVKHAKNAVAFQQAIKDGIIQPDQSPWFQKTWKEMDGSVAADRYNEDLLGVMSQGPLANSTDHTESAKMLDNFRTNWVNDNLQDKDPDFVSGFQAKAAGYELNVRAHQAARVGNNIVEAAADAFDQSVQGTLALHYSGGIPSDVIAKAINWEFDKAKLAGNDPKKLNEIVLKGLAASGMENLDVTHVEAVLADLNGGPGGKLAGTTAAKMMLEVLGSKISNELHQRDEWAYTEQQHKKQEIFASSTQVVATAMLQAKIDGKPVTLEQFAPQIKAVYNVGGWEQGQNFEKAILAAGKETFTEAAQQKADLLVSVLSRHEYNFDRLNRALAANEINMRTYEDLATKMNEGIRQEKADNKEPSFFKYPGYMKQGDYLDTFLKGDEAVWDATKVIKRDAANADYWTQIYIWDKQHPNATDTEKIDEATRLSQKGMEAWRNEQMKGMVGTVRDTINRAPGVRKGQVTPVGLPPGTAPQTDKLPKPEESFDNAADFERALNEANLNTTGTSRLDILASQHQMSLGDFIALQMQLFPEAAPKKAEPAKK